MKVLFTKKAGIFLVTLLTGVSFSACGRDTADSPNVTDQATESNFESKPGPTENNVSTEAETGTAESQESRNEPDDILPYVTDSLSNLESQKDVGSSYVTDRETLVGHYWIDEESNLWGRGYSYFIGDKREATSEAVKLDENVIHVDASDNYVVWITRDHELCGAPAGMNPDNDASGILACGTALERTGGNPENNYAVHLMDHIQFAAASNWSICVLTDDGLVYWWGDLYPNVAAYEEPHLMMSNAEYVSCATGTAAAIDENHQLWVWGDNTWGQCGSDPSVSELSFPEPHLAASDVEMVWLDDLTSRRNIYSEDLRVKYPHINWLTDYDYTTFIRKSDGTMMACGIDLPGNRKTVQTMGEDSYSSASEEMRKMFTRDFSFDFTNIDVQEWSVDGLKVTGPDGVTVTDSESGGSVRYGKYSGTSG